MRMVERRTLLKLLAAGPWVALSSGLAGCSRNQRAASSQTEASPLKVSGPEDALSILDFEEASRRGMPAAHWAFLESGVDDGGTVLANREAFGRVQLRPRRLRDVQQVETAVDLFGTTCSTPIFLCPVSGVKAFHSEGELAVARAARSRSAPMVLSTAASFSVEDVSAVFGRPPWFQLYPSPMWESDDALIARVESAGVSVVALTVDNVMGRNLEPYTRNRPTDLGTCTACHDGTPGSGPRPMTATLPKGSTPVRFDWALVDRIRRRWRGTFLIKGIETAEDARLCVEHGVDGIVVSNHGGRATETLRATIDALPEVVAAVNGSIPVLLDGGIRRGADVFKALALGATAVGIGRPYLWGLGAFGEAGVARVLDILNDELRLVMRSCGTTRIADISRDYIVPGQRSS